MKLTNQQKGAVFFIMFLFLIAGATTLSSTTPAPPVTVNTFVWACEACDYDGCTMSNNFTMGYTVP